MTTSRGTQRRFTIDAGKGEAVPALLRMPEAAGPVPAVLLLHGFNSHKERMADSLGAALVRLGIASLSVDLPSHGTRERTGTDFTRQNPLSLIALWRRALREAERSIAFLREHPGVDAGRIGVAGYSLGAYLGLFVTAGNDAVRVLVLAAGGDLQQGMPMESLVRSAADPRKAVKRLSGRPLLMVNGRSDRTIRAAQATALFEAAREPKELRWYDGGHWPPAAVIHETAAWLASQLEGMESEQRVTG